MRNRSEWTMKKVLISVILSALLIWPACSKKNERSARVETIDGVEYIHNPEIPLHPDKAVSFEEELSIGEEDEEGNIILYQPSQCLADEDGHIYICDYQDKTIKVFAPDGSFMRVVGAKGSGPGEFQNIGEFALLPDGRLLVLDWELKRTSLFSPEGKLINIHKWRNWSYNIYLTTNSSYTRDENIFGEKTQLFIKTYDFSGKELSSFGEFTHRHSQLFVEGGRRFSVSLPFDVRSIVIGGHKNMRLYHCLNNEYVIEVYNQDGKVFRKIDRPYKGVPVTEDDKKKYLEGFYGLSDTDRALIGKNVKMPELRTVTDRMIVDDQGNLWVETNEEKEVNGRTFTAYDIFNEDGFYEARIWSDMRPGLFKMGKMYRMHRDEETGYRTFKKYRVIWSE